MTTVVADDIYRTNSKQILVTRDPVYNHPAIRDGRYIGRQPQNYFILAVFVTALNPLLGPLALIFSKMSDRSFKDGDLTYARKWADYAFLTAIITIVASVVMYIAILFSLVGPSLRGGHSY